MGISIGPGRSERDGHTCAAEQETATKSTALRLFFALGCLFCFCFFYVWSPPPSGHFLSFSFSIQAELELAAAVKLSGPRSSTAVDAYNALGHCLWKRGDSWEASRACFEAALTADRNPVSLRELSKLLRHLPVRSAVEKTRRLQESLELAREAADMGGGGSSDDDGSNSSSSSSSSASGGAGSSSAAGDHESFYVLGNAFVSIFFSGVAGHGQGNAAQPDEALLDQALGAYGRSERLGGAHNPDLYFSRAQVHRFKEAFGLAAADYRTALGLDPGLPAGEALREVAAFLRRAHTLVRGGGGGLRPGRREQLAQALAAYEVRAPG